MDTTGFQDWTRPAAQMAKGVVSVPTTIAAGVGRVMVRWAYQEALMRLLVKNASGVAIKTARIALREPPIEQFAKYLSDILFVEGLAPAQNITQLGGKLVAAKERRDMLAHSVWIRDQKSKEIGIQWVRGSHDRKASEPRITRKMKPAFKPINAAYLRETIA